ncbi:MAG TPA: sigma-70 family RNA polymerase sigma factor, partial [Conexibacter sp.]|nr:sigma-70 family RNA polymerase sigma factor [Conexibacter sp.]
RRRQATLAADPADPTTLVALATDDELADDALRRTAVRTALDRLAPRERELVALKFHAGLTNAEIARVLGVSESNAGTLLHRTIAKLRKACDA